MILQIDENLRKSWDHYVAKLRTVDYDKISDCGLVHWVMKYPVSVHHSLIIVTYIYVSVYLCLF